jgi:hypothetical protein
VIGPREKNRRGAGKNFRKTEEDQSLITVGEIREIREIALAKKFAAASSDADGE